MLILLDCITIIFTFFTYIKFAQPNHHLTIKNLQPSIYRPINQSQSNIQTNQSKSIKEQKMSKTNTKQYLKHVTQVLKQKTNLYPYYPVSSKYQQSDNLFIFSVEYPVGVPCITFFMVGRDHVRRNGITNIELAGINDRSVVLVFQVVDFKFRERANAVEAVQATVLVGYREGQLVMVRFKDRRTDVLHRFNRCAKREGFFEKASIFFSSEEGYKTMIKGAIKTALYSPSRKYAISYLAGNVLVMNKTKEDKSQQILQKQFRKIPQDSYHKGIKIVIDEGIVFSVPKKEICTYIYTEKQVIFVAFSMQSVISCFSAKDLSLLYSITMQMPIRKINFYSYPEADFLTILPYEDYAILVNLNNRQYTKLIGYKCFIANSAIYRDKNKDGPLVFVSGGLDHRVCFDKIEDMKGWSIMEKAEMPSEEHSMIESVKNGYFIDEDKKGVEFSNKYSLGEYSNARTNSHDYGFSDLLFGLGLAVFPTYDGKIKVFGVNYR